ncbi:hypothetical protein M408DRAFT_178000 [Serendipita vermifera MAFF 305830]|uniref:F-box domain-containing protein n=1 Tax=Serendipita vermifera MAFF 305830 TaxID=933852 RepID=A0A0C2XCC3_SERVB|nr:hypothetical protein M408DRAFT_178000 [Serendipita vermifera MAFF 305830]
MNPTTTTRNGKLPLDVLTEIFPHYAAEETPQHPTETLLPICKSWHVAALAKHSIWGQFAIQIGHGSDTEMILRRTETRLKRSGDVSPMDIKLRNIVDIDPNAPKIMEVFEDHQPRPTPAAKCPTMVDKKSRWKKSCTCERSAYECVENILILLAGLDGRHCARWRSLILSPRTSQQHVRSDIGIVGDGRIAQMLLYPMPRLISLSMHTFMDKFSSGEQIFPHVPSLTHVVLSDCMISKIPNAKNLVLLGISFKSLIISGAWYKEQVWRTSMPRLKVLKLNCPRFPLSCPENFPQLRTLELRGERFPMYEAYTYTPLLHLSHLSLGIEGTLLLESLETSIPESLKHVKSLRLWYGGRFLFMNSSDDILLQLVRFLRLMSGLELLEGDIIMLSIVIKLIADPPESVSDLQLFGGQEISFRLSPGGPLWKLPSPSAQEDVAELASRLGVIGLQKSWRWVLK